VIDLLFTDINLGKGMNGVELAEWALTQHPRMAVLVTTGGTLTTGFPLALGEAIHGRRIVEARKQVAGVRRRGFLGSGPIKTLARG
jgi:hypothetical protein